MKATSTSEAASLRPLRGGHGTCVTRGSGGKVDHLAAAHGFAAEHSASTSARGQGVILPRIAAVFADAKSAAFFPPTHCRKRTAGISKRGRLPWPR